MSEDFNPLHELEQAEEYTGYDIALIDTGANGADASVSLTGDGVYDSNGHGTSMLAYIKEVYPEATVLSIKALGADGKGDVSAVYAAIKYAISADVKVINLSISAYATGENAIIADAVKEATEAGIVVVGSAGNNGANVKNFIPGNVDEAVIVGSADENGEKLSSSNYGSSVDYNVVAGSTSEAAAKMSAFIAMNGVDAIADVLNDGLIYETGYVAPESGENEDDDNIIFSGDIDGDFTVDDGESGGSGGSSSAGSGSWADPDGSGIQWVIYDDDDDALGLAYVDNDGKTLNTDAIIKAMGDSYVSDYNTGTGSTDYPIDQITKALTQAIADCYDAYVEANGTDEGFKPRIAAVGWATYNGDYSGSAYDSANSHWASAWDDAEDNITSLQHNGVSYEAGTTTSEGDALYYNDGGYKTLYTLGIDDLSTSNNVRIIVLDDTVPSPPNGEAYIIKKSGDTTITNGNDCYSLVGAEFTIYTDASCKTVATDADGNNAVLTVTSETSGTGTTSTITLKAGTYYVKETKAPTGYVLDTSVKALTVKSGETATVTFTDEPSTDPLTLTVSKNVYYNNEITDTAVEGAVFKVEYFDNYSCSGTATRTWYFESDDKGLVNFSSSRYLAGGSYLNDDLYYDENNRVAIPLGSIKVTEVEAPYGYEVSDVVLTATITLDSNGKANASWSGNSGSKVELDGDEITLGEDVSTTSVIVAKTTTSGMLTNLVSGNSLYSQDFSGAEFTVSYIYLGTTTDCGTLTTGSDGSFTVDDVPVGAEVTVTEVTAPEGYLLSETVTRTITTTDGDNTVTFEDDPAFGEIEPFTKAIYSADTVIEDDGIEDAVFMVEYYDNYTGEGEVTRTWYFATDEYGNVELGSPDYLADGYDSDDLYIADGTSYLPVGYYKVTEISTPNGIEVVGETFSYIIRQESNGSEAVTTNTIEESGVDYTVVDGTYIIGDTQTLAGVKIYKVSAETGEREIQGVEATFEGAEVTIYNVSDNEDWSSISDHKAVEGVKYYEGDDILTLTLDENGYAESDIVLPYGDYYFVETKTTDAGYLISEEVHYFTISDETVDEDGYVDLSDDPVEDYIIRADIEFSKMDIDGSSMAYIPFLVSLVDEDGNIIESHVAVTDANGEFNSAERTKSTENVNTLDDYYDAETGEFTGTADQLKEAATANIWFDELTAVEDGRGSLIYGHYVITELKCDANAGNDMLTTELFTEDDLTSVFFEGEVYEPDNTFIDLIIHLESDLIDDETGLKTVTYGEEVSVTDTIRYDHLKVTNTYKLVTEIVYVDRDGNSSAIGSSTIEFTPEKVDSTNTSNGTIDNTVIIDTTSLNGGYVCAVDYLYVIRDGDEILLTTHNEDLTDKGQMLDVPYVATVVKDCQTLTHTGAIVENAEIVDTVEYEGLADKGVYTVTATLRYADTGEVVTGSDGQPCVVEQVIYVLEKATGVTTGTSGMMSVPMSGSFDMPAFTIDATGLAGETLVVTEEITDYYTGKTVAMHYDLTDEDQSIHYMTADTSAEDSETGTRVSRTSAETTTIDIVTINNTVVGGDYTVCGTLVYQEDFVDAAGAKHFAGETIAESGPVTVTATDTTTVVEIEFTYDASILCGTAGVVFEDVYYNNTLVASHHDINDESQTVCYPAVGTTAADDRTDDSHIGTNDEYTTVTDTVELSNLVAGDTYKVIGQLMFSDGTEVAINGETVTAESEVFIATEKEETVELTFSLDTSELAGKTVVAFEKLFVVKTADDEDTSDEVETSELVEVAGHEDSEDADQSIYIPLVETEFTDSSDGSHAATAIEGSNLTDTVALSNLVPGYTYKLVAYIYDKTTGELLEGIEVETTFTADAADMAVELEFADLDLTGLGTHALVAFEYLYYVNLEGKDVPVGEHEDPEDPEQTVLIKTPEPQTGLTMNNTALFGGIVLAALAGLAFVSAFFFKKKKKAHQGW